MNLLMQWPFQNALAHFKLSLPVFKMGQGISQAITHVYHAQRPLKNINRRSIYWKTFSYGSKNLLKPYSLLPKNCLNMN